MSEITREPVVVSLEDLKHCLSVFRIPLEQTSDFGAQLACRSKFWKKHSVIRL